MRTEAARLRPALERAGELAALIALLLAAWQLMHHVAGDVAMTTPAQTVRYTAKLLASADFWPHARTTAKAFTAALLIAITAGSAIGMLLGFHRLAGEVAEPMLVAMYSIPKVILYPIILLVFGLGLPAEIAFGTLHGIVPVMVFTMNAVRNIKPVFIRTGRVLRLSTWTLMRTVLLPAAFPEIFTGLRIGFSVTLLGTVLSEMFGSKRGLGFLLMNALGVNNVQLIMSLALMLVVFAAVSNSLLMVIERRVYRLK
ncbi:MAG TPA: ABC transporter permease subunit [Casimicrobiaceae bacterium]